MRFEAELSRPLFHNSKVWMILFILFLLSRGGQGATWSVGSGGDFGSLSAALASPSVAEGDVLELLAGAHACGALTWTKRVSIMGAEGVRPALLLPGTLEAAFDGAGSITGVDLLASGAVSGALVRVSASESALTLSSVDIGTTGTGSADVGLAADAGALSLEDVAVAGDFDLGLRAGTSSSAAGSVEGSQVDVAVAGEALEVWGALALADSSVTIAAGESLGGAVNAGGALQLERCEVLGESLASGGILFELEARGTTVTLV
ncbi:hypothetical protein JXA32_07020, partial [Candidatus Sumerlaeota bacterium]|nr:hypothetical protein [Candidatus Sumerlaeota bacterium]